MLARRKVRLGELGADHSGKAIATYQLDKADLAIDEWGPLASTTVLATEVPSAFEKAGIGAFISPQRLDEEGDAILVDLAKGEMRSAWWDSAYDELGSRGAALVGSACDGSDGPAKSLAFVVPATIESHEVQLLVDTGAQISDVFLSSPTGKRLAGQGATNSEPLYTVSGKIPVRKLKAARVSTGSFAVTTDVDLIEGAADTSCPRDGVLAMDVLRSCALLFGRSKVHGSCSPRK